MDGNCLDMMNEPEGSDFHTKVKARAYPTLEQGGVIWAYLGPDEQRPAPPNFEWTQVAETHRHISKNSQETNWLQGLEGGIDSSHAPILHRTISAETNRPGIGINTTFVTGGAPRLEVDATDYGYQYVGVRDKIFTPRFAPPPILPWSRAGSSGPTWDPPSSGPPRPTSSGLK